jgi:hypothetical protein
VASSTIGTWASCGTAGASPPDSIAPKPAIVAIVPFHSAFPPAPATVTGVGMETGASSSSSATS